MRNRYLDCRVSGVISLVWYRNSLVSSLGSDNRVLNILASTLRWIRACSIQTVWSIIIIPKEMHVQKQTSWKMAGLLCPKLVWQIPPPASFVRPHDWGRYLPCGIWAYICPVSKKENDLPHDWSVLYSHFLQCQGALCHFSAIDDVLQQAPPEEGVY